MFFRVFYDMFAINVKSLILRQYILKQDFASSSQQKAFLKGSQLIVVINSIICEHDSSTSILDSMRIVDETRMNCSLTKPSDIESIKRL